MLLRQTILKRQTNKFKTASKRSDCFQKPFRSYDGVNPNVY